MIPINMYRNNPHNENCERIKDTNAHLKAQKKPLNHQTHSGWAAHFEKNPLK